MHLLTIQEHNENIFRKRAEYSQVQMIPSGVACPRDGCELLKPKFHEAAAAILDGKDPEMMTVVCPSCNESHEILAY